MIDLILNILPGLPTSLSLTFSALFIAFVLAVVFTLILSLKTPVISQAVKVYITLFTGTPLLVQFFLIYNGPSQFKSLQNYPLLWDFISTPWVCAVIALALNSAAYSTLLFHGAVKAIPSGQWQSCQALGMSKAQTMRIILPYAFKRSLSSYSNEVVLIFKSTSLASTITMMDIMGYSSQVFGQSWDVMAFVAAGIIYLVVNAILTIIMRLIERQALAFEQRS
ncbi:arginine ABC transporter permease ArtM [Providencia vermicola]|uniref:Arginine ABC transporter permease protein ArtM n=1 Tax=Providencia vermicola TaxID=333965 RepID=A0AAX3RUH1_9GAMM|nr:MULTISPECIES: arginine ABC transporter permease ArtM [Providencia]ELX8380181.1 arginine ABC transporter permease ArtM [Providencia stuartii]ELZ5941152.1 arginine ABC transporter permease ArtM [Providencia stuartii]EMD5259718.1 arginine ABC transporter permease ArtM [Providencia stuartii]MBG5921062.1 arginine ABC transporter permease ArtM [Providencia stuartii]MCK1144503.1 arginine ABC transporter permease ArtM [Providencia stuartii]